MNDLYLGIAAIIILAAVAIYQIVSGRRLKRNVSVQVNALLSELAKESLKKYGTQLIVANEAVKFAYTAIDEEEDFFAQLIPPDKLEIVREAFETFIDVTQPDD